MRIRFFGYNCFILETGKYKVAIDPGALFLYYLRLTSLIPKTEWPDITHIFVTHGDPDHYFHADRVAQISCAPLICHKKMLREVDGKQLILGPRDKGLKFTTEIDNVHPIEPSESINVNGVEVTGIPTIHGELLLKIGPFKKVLKPGPHERVGWGAIGFEIKIDGFTIVNLGDTLLLEEEWQHIKNPDILMLPIGGRKIHNTMDEEEALKAVEQMQPRLVIPCHYNCKAFFTDKYNPADEKSFQHNVERLGLKCSILQPGEELNI